MGHCGWHYHRGTGCCTQQERSLRTNCCSSFDFQRCCCEAPHDPCSHSRLATTASFGCSCCSRAWEGEPHVDSAHDLAVLSHGDCGCYAGDLSSKGTFAPRTGSVLCRQPWTCFRCAVAGACGETCLQEPAQQLERLLSTSRAASLACCDFDVASEPWLRWELP